MPDYNVNISFVVSRKGDGFQQMEKNVQQIKKSVEQMSGASVDANKKMQGGINQSGLKWTELKSKIDLAVGALRTIKQAGEEFFNLLREGAALEETERKFTRLAETIGTTADALKDDLGVATGGLLTTAEQMALATDLMTLGLASTHDEAIRLSNVAAQLGFDMNQLVLTLTNQTTMRFDALGLSVDGFDEKVQTLKDSGLAANEAFKLAFLEQAEEQLDRVGSIIDTNAGKLEILAANWRESTDNMKRGILDAAAPIISKLADMVTAANDAEIAIKNIGESASAWNDLQIAVNAVKAAIDEVGATGTPFAPVQTIRTRDALKELAAQISVTTGSFEEQKAKLESYGFTVDDIGVKLNGMGISWIEVGKAVEAVRLDQAAKEAEQFDIALTRVQSSSEGVTSATRLLALANLENTNIIEDHLIGLLKEEAVALGGVADETEEASEEAEELAAAMRELEAATGDYFIGALEAEEGASLFGIALSDLGEQSAFVSDMTGQQAEDLQLLQNAYSKAEENVRQYELGVKGANLSDDARNEKIQEQLDIMAELSPKIAELVGIGGDYITWTNDAVFNQDALNRSLFEAVDNAGGGAEALAELGVKTGIMSEEMADAALKSAAMQGKIDELGGLIAEGMGIDEALGLLDEFQDRLNRQYILDVDVAAALAKMNDMISSADALANKLAGLGGPEGLPPPLPGGGTGTGGGTGGQGATGGIIPGLQHGGLVFGGIPGQDSVHARLMEGERVLSVGQNAAFELLMKTLNRTGFATGGSMPPELARSFGPHGVADITRPANGIRGDTNTSVVIENINVESQPGMDTQELVQEFNRQLGADLRSRVSSRAIGSRF